MKHIRRRNRKAKVGSNTWLWMSGVVIMLVTGGIFAFAALSGSQADGALHVEQPVLDLGRVSMHDGLLETTFPLTVVGEVLVTEITTT